LGVTTGLNRQTPRHLSISLLTEPFIGETLIYNSNTVNPEPPCQYDPDITRTNPEVPLETPLQLGYLDIFADPEAEEPPEIHGTIHGQPARILLDSGCSTYVLSTDFAEQAKITQYPTKRIPVQLAIKNASQPYLESKTQKLSMSIGEQLETQKAFYVLPLPRYDAILGTPFIKEFDVTFPTDKPIACIGNIEVPLVNASKELEDTCQIAVISRRRFKAMSRRNEFEEVYLATTRILDDDEETSETPETQKNSVPVWIQQEYGEIFLEGLPPATPQNER